MDLYNAPPPPPLAIFFIERGFLFLYFPKQALVITCLQYLLKILREKDKLLVTSNLYFSHSVFYPFG